MKNIYFIFKIALWGIISSGYAQITPPDSIVVELTGPSTSQYELPAKMVIKLFGSASAAFVGSNNKPETGFTNLGYYSAEVEAGATFFPLLGQPAGFPGRGSSSPTPNRTGGSSFLAIKVDAEGNRKYWMNISVGAFRISGTTTLNWEYQFRYSFDSKTGSEIGTIGAVPNSGAYTPTPVDFLVSLGSNKCKPFTGVVKNASANFVTAKITNDPLPGASVTLKEAGSTLKTVISDNLGKFNFLTDSLSKDKLYTISVDFTAENGPLNYTLNNIKICNAAPDFIIPARLYRQVNTESAGLKNLKIDAAVFGGAVADAIPVKDYNLSTINGQIGKWNKIETQHKEILETMSRTYLSLYLLNQYYSKGNEFSGKLCKLTYDVAEGIFKMLTATRNISGLMGEESTKIDKKLLTGVSGIELYNLKKDLIILNSLKSIVKQIEKALLDGFKEGIVKAALAKFGNSPSDQVAKASILTLSKAIETAMFGGNLGEDILKNIAFNIGTKILVDQYYIGSSQTYIDKISPKITGLTADGTFAAVAPLVTQRIAKTDQDNLAAINAGEAFESASGQFGAVADFTENAAKIAALTVFGAPLAPPLLTISKFVKGFSAVSNTLALYQYSSRYFYITDELQEGLAKSFSPSAGNMLRVEEEQTQARMEANPTDLTAYKDSLAFYKTKIGVYNLLNEVRVVDDINQLEEIAAKKIGEKVNLLYSVISANPTEPSFLKVYNEVVKNKGDLSNRQLALDIAIITHFIDSTNSSYALLVKSEIDTLIGIVSVFEKSLKRIDSVLLVTSGTSSQLVRVSDIIVPDTIRNNSQFEVTVKYKNYGNTATAPFDILFEPSDKLSLAVDSIRVPPLSSQQESSIKLVVTAGDINRNPFMYVSFNKVNSLSETVIFKLISVIRTKDDVVTNIDNYNEADNAMSVEFFPNPATSYIKLSANKSLKNVKLSIVDLQGIIQFNQSISAVNLGEIITVPTNNLKDGIYIFNLADENGYSVKRDRIIISNLK
ncbi:MAG: T9SS type A sorting domain-containing protein [Opitutaceae bacterium]|nr:T9SS type A sorting domain-containing protein [Cytophagales bacterium]